MDAKSKFLEAMSEIDQKSGMKMGMYRLADSQQDMKR